MLLEIIITCNSLCNTKLEFFQFMSICLYIPKIIVLYHQLPIQAGNPAFGRFTSVEEGPSPFGSITLREHHPQGATPFRSKSLREHRTTDTGTYYDMFEQSKRVTFSCTLIIIMVVLLTPLCELISRFTKNWF